MDVVAIVNPTKLEDLGEAQRRLNHHVGRLGMAPPSWVLTTVDDSGTGQAKRAVAAGADLVLVWGGDGTVTAVAAGLDSTGVPMGLLPGGTGNLLARNLDVPLQFDEAVRVAFGGRDRSIDLMSVSLGRGDQRISTVMCGTGWDAAMMDVSEKVKARLGWGAYALQAARTVRQHPLRMRVRVDDGEEHSFYGRTCLIANVGTLIGGLTLLPESEPDDATIEVLVFDPTTLADYVRTSWGVVRGRSNASDPARTLLRGKKAVVTTHKSRPRQIDGDLVSDGYGFVVRVKPAALVVRVTS
ncbi:MAG TPA: diacylglycerol kinase family protein [Actinomycetes bacterium]|nr:diacylglycerol kinase family protein [Actinomycetes bacterium]